MSPLYSDPRVPPLLEKIRSTHRQIFGDNLVGIYVHGSLAFGCFRWETGDIDYLVAVHDPPPLRDRTALVAALLQLDRDAPPKGLEMSVMLDKDCRDFVHPAPFVFHFSNLHKERARKDPEAYCREMTGEDPDLAAHVMVTRERGQVLYGPPARSVFSTVPREAWLDSIRTDVREAAAYIESDPVYGILNLCRVLAFLRDGSILSKEEGGTWGMTHLPEQYRPLIRNMRDRYTGADGKDRPWTDEARAMAREFAGTMLPTVLTESFGTE